MLIYDGIEHTDYIKDGEQMEACSIHQKKQWSRNKHVFKNC